MATVERACCSAPGKAILFGEHAVVYGYQCLVGAIDLRTTVQIGPSNDGRVHFQTSNFEYSASWAIEELEQFLSGPFGEFFTGISITPRAPTPDLVSALNDLASKAQFARPLSPSDPEFRAIPPFLFCTLGICRRPLAPLRALVQSMLPIGAGLGSSASFVVSLVAAMLAATKTHAVTSTPLSRCASCACSGEGRPQPFCAEQLRLINDWGLQCERLLHTNPSGVDNTCATFGGIFAYSRAPGQATPTLEPISLSPGGALPAGSPPPLSGDIFLAAEKSGLHLVVVDTGVPRETRHLVEKVAWLRRERPAETEALLEAIGRLSTRAVALLNNVAAAAREWPTTPAPSPVPSPSPLAAARSPSVPAVASPCAAPATALPAPPARLPLSPPPPPPPAPVPVHPQGIAALSPAPPPLRRDVTSPPIDLAQLGAWMEANHECLRALGLSHERIEMARAALLESGIPSKLTGAGGGGCVIGFLSAGATPAQSGGVPEREGFGIVGSGDGPGALVQRIQEALAARERAAPSPSPSPPPPHDCAGKATYGRAPVFRVFEAAWGAPGVQRHSLPPE